MRNVLNRSGKPETQAIAGDRDAAAQSPVLSVRNLSLEYEADRGAVKAVRQVSFDLLPGEALALIGESGCGKTTLATALIGLLAKTARITEGEIIYRRDGRSVDVLALRGKRLRRFRWKECAMVFQGALNAFNPVLTIERQFQDTAAEHGWKDKAAVRARTRDLLKRVQLDPDRVLRAYAFELSGGMRQRVLIALALLLEPQLIILDEPTTALDVLTQRQIIDMLNRLRRELGFSVIFVSHDLAMASELADRVATMYAGCVVEQGTNQQIFENARHPYTFRLLQATPTLHSDVREMRSIAGSPPDLIDLPGGCPFHPRCPLNDEDRCVREEPPLIPTGGGQAAACWYHDRVHSPAVNE